MAIDIRQFNYKVRCDITGCKNLADVSVGDERHPMNLRHNFCNNCLQQIILAAPQEMILKRADIAEIAGIVGGVEPIKEIIEGIDYENMTMQQLRAIAKAKGSAIPFSTTKDEAIAMVRSLAKVE